jgi:hypothetical protein
MKAIDRTDSMDSLVRRANERFAWHWQKVRVAGQASKLAVASDPDGMLIDACHRQDAGEEGVIDPFWATTWRAAAGLDEYLNRIDLEGVRVLEVGCGTGHVGLSAAHRGGEVTLTDGVSDPLLLVQLSTWQLRDRCRVRRLRFGITPNPAARIRTNGFMAPNLRITLMITISRPSKKAGCLIMPPSPGGWR